MQLWTHHPSVLDLLDENLVLDHTLGEYWHRDFGGFFYCDVLPELQNRLGTSQFLWCCTARGKYPLYCEKDRVEWELNISIPNEAVRLYNEQAWKELIHDTNWQFSARWDDLLLPSDTTKTSEETGALVFLPLQQEWITCHGQMQVEPKVQAGPKPKNWP